jgi:hypothetical protein
MHKSSQMAVGPNKLCWCVSVPVTWRQAPLFQEPLRHRGVAGSTGSLVQTAILVA